MTPHLKYQHMFKHRIFLRNLLLSVAVSEALLPIFASAQESTALQTSTSASQRSSALDAEVERQLARMGQEVRTPARVALSPDGAWLAWSLPDAAGTTLHVSETTNPKHDIVVAPVSTAGNSCSSDTPSWSPDSETLAFTAVCAAPGAATGTRPQLEIFLWSRKSGTVRQLTHLKGAEQFGVVV
jgi:Tol biopolymer transport system component